jgi:hypothetical protein
MTPTNIFTTFYNMGGTLAAQMTPYSLNLFYFLILVEIATISITWMRGNDDIPDLLWRIVYLLFTSAFAFWWITDSWTLGKTVLGSFNSIGENITHVPMLTPSQFFDATVQIVKMLWSAPSSARIIPNVALALGTIALAIFIMIFLSLVAFAAMFTIAAGLLLIGPGSFFLAFMVCRFTTTLSENYFIWLIRTGAAILGFFIVLATCQSFAAQWTATLTHDCAGVMTTIPFLGLGATPTMVPTFQCTQPIPTNSLFTLFGDAFLVAIIGLGIPILMATFAGSGIHLALEHLAAAKYLGSSAIRTIAGGVQTMSHQISRMRQESSNQNTLQQRINAGAEAAARVAPTQQQPPSPSVNSYGVQPTQNLNGGSRQTTKI